MRSTALRVPLVVLPLIRGPAEQVGDWVEASGKRLTHTVATHGHGGLEGARLRR
ncbi:hypothetical protein [Streptomyces sp. NBC_01244]|uniref:hypothetical protein n=1 Tax=Streptomyces sp. NBC_01244 TaxID=2903797 RepID=UPI002E14C870|nr:hypothetical protein OG247_01030 [Streptomyces sp. NBC_01244]